MTSWWAHVQHACAGCVHSHTIFGATTCQCRSTLDERLRTSAEKGRWGCRPQAAYQRATLFLARLSEFHMVQERSIRLPKTEAEYQKMHRQYQHQRSARPPWKNPSTVQIEDEIVEHATAAPKVRTRPSRPLPDERRPENVSESEWQTYQKI